MTVRLILAGAVLAVYAPALGYGFVHWDDLVHITENPYLREGSARGLLHFWTGPHKHLYIPLTYSVWWALARISLSPWLFHAVNLLCHLLATWLAFGLLRSLLAARSERPRPELDAAAGVGALLFAWHPLQVEPVAWASGTRDVLCGLFSLYALREYVAFRRAGGGGRYARASVGLLLALLAKPAAVVVPLLALVLDRLVLGRPLRSAAGPLSVWLLASAGFAWLASAAQPAGDAVLTPPPWQRLFVAGDAVAFYLFKLALPFRLGIDYGRTPESVLSHAWGYLTWLLPAALFVLALARGRRSPWLAALLLFVLALAPVLGGVPFRHQKLSTVADRYAYLPLLGAGLAAGFAFLRAGRGGRLALLALLLGLGVTSAFQLRVWRDSQSLFRHALRVNPQSVAAHYNLGLLLEQRGEPEAALSRYRRVVEIDPEHAAALYNVGVHAKRAGRRREAIRYFEEAVAADPTFSAAMVNLGVAWVELGDAERGAAWFARALEADPESRSAAANLETLRRLRAERPDAPASRPDPSGLRSETPSDAPPTDPGRP